MDPVSSAPNIPEQEASVGKYKLIASLGHGGMADVYLAAVSGPAGINKLQVIKRLRRESATDPERVAMFLDEARLAARVNHPNVVQTFEVGAAEGAYFIAMEYLEGAPFNRLINRARTNPPKPGVLLHILADVLAGLHHAHELTDYDGTPLHVVHRDASPHNVLVTYEGQTKLLDFGIATSDVREADPKAGAVQGKVQYMAPEQARAKDLDRRADVFVMGIVLWEILAGRKMWERASNMEILHRLATGALPKLEDVRKNVPEPLARIAARALAVDPADRYATAAAMRSDLTAYLDDNDLRVSPEDIGRWVTEQYADKREEIQRVIERQLGKLARSRSGTFHADTPLPESVEPESLARMSSTPLGINGSGTLPSIPAYRSMPPSVPPPPEAPPSAAPEALAEQKAAAPEAIPIPTTQPAPAERAAQMRMAVMAAALVLVAALGAFAGLRMRSAQKAAESAAQAMQGAEKPQQKARGPRTSITLRVRATPSHAKLFLDGAPLSTNPFSGDFPVDGIGHRLRAEAPEHHPAAQIVMFDKDNTIDLVLAPKTDKP